MYSRVQPYGASHLDGILAGPLASRRLVPGSVRLVDMGNFRYKRVVGVGVSQHRANR